MLGVRRVGRRGRGRGRRLELARVGVVRGVLELAVRAQVVGARVSRAAQRALEPPREVHVIVVPDVRHHLAAQLAPVQVERAGHALERQPHVPALRACNQPAVTAPHLTTAPPRDPLAITRQCRSANPTIPYRLPTRRLLPTSISLHHVTIKLFYCN